MRCICIQKVGAILLSQQFSQLEVLISQAQDIRSQNYRHTVMQKAQGPHTEPHSLRILGRHLQSLRAVTLSFSAGRMWVESRTFSSSVHRARTSTRLQWNRAIRMG